MTEFSTIAKPYAKAAFEFANEHQTLAAWSAALQSLKLIVRQQEVQAYLQAPTISDEQCAAMILDLAQAVLDEHQQNFVRLLAEKQRLIVLPQIANEFEILRAQAEQTVTAKVTSAFALNDEQRESVKQALHKRLRKNIEMECEVDAALIGGMVIHAGDLVIDYSVVNQLQRLETAIL